MKKEMGGRLARTRAALDALDGEQRQLMEGHRPGAYLRLSFSGAVQPCAASLACHLPGTRTAAVDFGAEMPEAERHGGANLYWRPSCKKDSGS